MADTVVHHGATWSQRADGSIWMWDETTTQWKQWAFNPRTTHPLPPPAWVEAAREASDGDEERAQQARVETPQIKARAAKDSGAKIFQIALPVASDGSSSIADIEAEGWTLDHAGYVSGPADAIIGVYIFRARA